MLFSPEFRSIRIDYFTYKPSETFDSDEVYDLGDAPLRALHKVEWSSDEPAGTDTKVYFRTAATKTAIASASWEEVASGQQVFTYQPAKFFEYRTILSSTDSIATPVVNSLVFTFNRGPDPSTALNPLNESHWGSTTPEFTWTFQDPDGLSTDSQQAYSLQVSFLEDFIYLNYESGAVVTNISSCISNPITPDGWYYWRVKTQDNYGTWGAWSPVHRVYIDTASPSPPEISCYTHPSEGTWYSRTTAIFDWDEASDISDIAGYSYALNQTADTDPPEEIMLSADEFNLRKNENIFTGLVRYDGLSDGEWYFHLRAVDTLGHWGSTNSFIFRVDHSPPTVLDLSDEEATTGEDLEFSFELDDNHSGLLSAELFWRYDVESVFQSELYNIVNEDTIYFKYPMKDIEAEHIEYYVIVKDNAANESNAYRYPATGYAEIPLLDNDPPTILDTSGEFTQDLSKEMTIFVKAKDNIDVTSAKVYITGEAAPREMTEVANDVFELTINPVELNDIFKSGDVADISYYFSITDGSSNNVTWPAASTFKISSSTTGGPDTNGEGKTDKETAGLSYPVAAGIIVVIVVVFLVLLWFMLRRKEESMEEERSKFKLAMLQTDTEVPGVQPATAMPGATSPEGEIAGMAGMPPKGLPPSPPQALPPAQMPQPEAPGIDYDIMEPEQPQQDMEEVDTESDGAEELPEDAEMDEPGEDDSEEDDGFSFKRPGSYSDETEE
jgi:hypothetical protein